MFEERTQEERLWTMRLLPARMKHLEGAINMIGLRGMCFHRSVAFVLDVPQAILVVATIPAATPEQRAENPEFSDVDFIHAWPQACGLVFPPSWMTPEGTMKAVSTSEYYKENNPYNFHYMKRATLKKLSKEYGFTRHFSHFTPLKDNASFGGIILNTLGIPYEVSEDGGVIPSSGRKNESVSLSSMQD